MHGMLLQKALIICRLDKLDGNLQPILEKLKVDWDCTLVTDEYPCNCMILLRKISSSNDNCHKSVWKADAALTKIIL